MFRSEIYRKHINDLILELFSLSIFDVGGLAE